jgi:tetratricopeptide (TPR) repeat protein
LRKEYAVAREEFGRLYDAAKRTDDVVMTSYLCLRVGQCLKLIGQTDAARKCLVAVQGADSHVVRAWACRELAAMDLSEGQYLQARSRAYAALAAARCTAAAGPLELDCDFLIGRAVTQKVVTDAGPISWKEDAPANPFDSLDDAALRKLLAQGPSMSKALLGPQVEPVRDGAGMLSWKVLSLRAPLEDLLGRLSAKSGTEIRFASVSPAARGRGVTLFDDAITEQRLCEIAGGMVGLVARYTGQQLMLQDPQAANSVKEESALLADEAVAHWRRLCLRCGDDPRIPYAYFSIAALLETSGDLDAAMSQYQLTASRFPRHPVAAPSLLHCAKIRLALRDFRGAREDLLNLLNSYPDSPGCDTIYLTLGQANMKSGLLQEAADTFVRLYFRELSLTSRTGACLGAGQCYYQQGKYDQACQWLQRYLTLAKTSSHPELASGCLLLGKSHSAKERWSEASSAFYLALRNGAAGQDRFDAFIGLAKSQVERQCYASALGLLKQVEKEKLTEDQYVQVVLLQGRSLRAMGLAEESVHLMRAALGRVDSESAQSAIRMEMVRSYIQGGQRDEACVLLVEMLPKLPTGQSQQAQCDLAELSLDAGRLTLAEALCRQLLAGKTPDELRSHARELLGQILVREGHYDQAVAVLAAGPNTGGGRP